MNRNTRERADECMMCICVSEPIMTYHQCASGMHLKQFYNDKQY